MIGFIGILDLFVVKRDVYIGGFICFYFCYVFGLLSFICVVWYYVVLFV